MSFSKTNMGTISMDGKSLLNPLKRRYIIPRTMKAISRNDLYDKNFNIGFSSARIRTIDSFKDISYKYKPIDLAKFTDYLDREADF